MKKLLFLIAAFLLLGGVILLLTRSPALNQTVAGDKTSTSTSNEVASTTTGDALPPIVVDDFEGEADPSRMTLTMNKWNWISANEKGTAITPRQPNLFTLTFSKDGIFGATTDCNSVGGKYAATKTKITFSEIVSTQMFCEGSQEADFARLLQNTSEYHFTSRGELVLELALDGGTATFR